MKGVARRKAQTFGVRIRCRTRRAPLGAPHALLVRYRASRYLSACRVAHLERMLISRRFLRHTPGRAFAVSAPPPLLRPVGANLSALGVERGVRQRWRESTPSLTVISQLLAGLRIEPGRSPDAARVPDCDPARGRRAPSRFCNASRKRPSKGRGGASISEVWGAGIKRGQEREGTLVLGSGCKREVLSLAPRRLVQQ